MNFKTILTRLYFLLVYADGKLNDREILMGKLLIDAEGINESDFRAQMESLKSKDKTILMSDCVIALKKLDRKLQVKCVAWLCVIANADGFMDKAEWAFIYNVYHKSLGLPLDEVMVVQKKINQVCREKASAMAELLEAA